MMLAISRLEATEVLVPVAVVMQCLRFGYDLVPMRLFVVALLLIVNDEKASDPSQSISISTIGAGFIAFFLGFAVAVPHDFDSLENSLSKRISAFGLVSGCTSN